MPRMVGSRDARVVKRWSLLTPERAQYLPRLHCELRESLSDASPSCSWDMQGPTFTQRSTLQQSRQSGAFPLGHCGTRAQPGIQNAGLDWNPYAVAAACWISPSALTPSAYTVLAISSPSNQLLRCALRGTCRWRDKKNMATRVWHGNVARGQMQLAQTFLVRHG